MNDECCYLIVVCGQWHAARRGKKSASLTAAFLVYRWLLAGLLVAALIASIVLDIAPAKWPVYFTNWGFSMLTAQAILAAVLATRQVCWSKTGSYHFLKYF